MIKQLSQKLAESKFVKKLRGIKHIEIIILVVFIGVILLICFSSNIFSNSSSSTVSVSYATQIEERLEKVLSQIDGAGNVNVMVMVESSSTLVIATSKEEKTNSSTTSSSSSENTTVVETPIVITKNGTSSPLVLQEIMPEVKGVVVVASGANNVKVKLELLKAVQSALNLDISCIEIFVGK